eukprot:2141841-Rhodomonas_salina.1
MQRPRFRLPVRPLEDACTFQLAADAINHMDCRQARAFRNVGCGVARTGWPEEHTTVARDSDSKSLHLTVCCFSQPEGHMVLAPLLLPIRGRAAPWHARALPPARTVP